jgi:hypothetical protein
MNLNVRHLTLCLIFSLLTWNLSAAVFNNGDFESPVLSVPDSIDVENNEITGWIKSGPGRLILLHNVANNLVPPKSGSQQLMFNSGDTAVGAIISRTISTMVGKQYQVRFYVGRAGTSGGNMGITAYVRDSAANVLYSNRFQAPSTETYSAAIQFSFTATTTSSVLAFEDTSLATIAVDVLLDAVSVTPTVLISSQPQSTEVRATENVLFNVVAEGIGNLSYQWRKNGTAIPQATSASLNLGAVNKTHEGSYDVVITDDNGSETSQAATLIVISPAIFTSPTSRSSYAGLSTTFSVVAAGTGSVSYQWRKNGVNLPNATSSTLNLSPVKYGHAGDYDVVVTDEFDTATSETATLTVLSPAPNVSISPGDTTVNPGAGHSFTATISTGLPPYTYQWRRNGTPLAKATSAALVLTNIQSAQAGVYDVVVKNPYGVDVSNAARLSLPPQVPVIQSPVSVDVDPAGTASFTVNVPGATAWQWLKNGTPIKGATSSTLNVPNVDASAAGLFSVTVTTPNGKVTTAPAQLRVNDAGLLIYKLTGTGKAYEGTVAANAALSGYLVLDRAGQRGGLIIGSKSGSQNIHRLEIHEDLDTQSTGPVPKSQTVVSELVAGEFALWMDGTDSLLTISKTDKAVGPATIKGYANSIDLGSNVRIETVSLTLALDAVNSTPARLFQETVEQAMSRISQDMQAKGSALVE